MEQVRLSPIDKLGVPVETEIRNGWQIITEYENQGSGPWLVDLSHVDKWDVQDNQVDDIKPFGLTIPTEYNHCLLADGWLINRMNRTQAYCWRLSGEDFDQPEEINYTELTDGLTMLAVVGDDALTVMEKICTLDLGKPGLPRPVLFQGPVMHMPAQIVVCDGAVIFTFSRGYGQTMAEAILHSAHELGLRAAGEGVFKDWLAAQEA